jgi:hypothetical protein
MLNALGQQAFPSIFNTRDTFELTGKIDPYRPSEMKDSIRVTTFNIGGWPKDTAFRLDKDGGFRIRLYRPYGGEIVLTYGSTEGILYATASEKMSVLLCEDEWKLTGRSTAVTNTIWEYQHHYGFRNFSPDPHKDTSITDKQYAEKRIQRMKEELSFLDVYIEARKPVSPVFVEWCKNNIRYSAARAIVFRCFAGKINNRISYQELMALLKDFPVANPMALHNAEYYGFINMLAVGFMIIANNDKELPQENSRLTACLKQVDMYVKGWPKELMYYNIYAFAVAPDKKEPPVEARLLRMVKDPVLKRQMVADRLNLTLVLKNEP